MSLATLIGLGRSCLLNDFIQIESSRLGAVYLFLPFLYVLELVRACSNARLIQFQQRMHTLPTLSLMSVRFGAWPYRELLISSLSSRRPWGPAAISCPAAVWVGIYRAPPPLVLDLPDSLLNWRSEVANPAVGHDPPIRLLRASRGVVGFLGSPTLPPRLTRYSTYLFLVFFLAAQAYLNVHDTSVAAD